jgi:hypothetical protein
VLEKKRDKDYKRMLLIFSRSQKKRVDVTQTFTETVSKTIGTVIKTNEKKKEAIRESDQTKS